MQEYLQLNRDALLWKLEGLSEYDARRPLTPTGTNLAGLVKHVALLEIGYFGDTFGRPWPVAGEVISDEDARADPNVDFYLTPNETVEQIVDFYRRVWAHTAETFGTFAVDDLGHVPHWPAENAEKSLGEIATHVLGDLARHVGHADILRERLDGSTGMWVGNDNVLGGVDWSSYVEKLERIASQFR
ncbi:MAG TPA: DinB family protein [Candidatus Corynebacterium avicola]|uniref:DinB family protein n=1 Tax=Candidatus Corynebacterium avicola TaxID=2838527 RepID=A0A9D1RQ51_9CORY|nr:DinB family protein [Candidatus Corynebacterium avicola]